MSAEAIAGRAPAVPFVDARSRRVLRYAFGATLATALATSLAWDLAFITPVLSLPLLAAPNGWMGFRAAVGFLAVIAIGCGAALIGVKLLLPYPVAFLLVFGLLLLRLFFASGRGAPAFPILWLLVSLLLLPLIAGIHPQAAVGVAQALVFGATVSLFVVWIANLVVPEPASPDVGAGARTPPEERRAPATPPDLVATATAQALVVLPVFVVFQVFQLAGASLILVFVAILALQPSTARDFSSGVPMIVGNTVGGLASIVVFELLTLAPSFPLFVTLVLLVGLVAGGRLFSDRKEAPLYGMAFSTFLLVLGSTTTSVDGDASSKVYDRILQIVIAVLYVGIAFALVDRLRRRGGV